MIALTKVATPSLPLLVAPARPRLRSCSLDRRGDIFHAPEPIGNAGRHGGRHAMRLKDLHEVPDRVERDHVNVVLDLFENALVGLLNRRICIRMVRF
jgi:hypothetical protein